MMRWLLPAAVAAAVMSMHAPVGAQLSTAAPTACPTPEEVLPLHLYGDWTAKIDGLPGETSVHFTPHAELSGSVSGSLERTGTQAQIAGDVDGGDFTLEESIDGQRISATWIGVVTPNSCGKEISGTWTQEKNPETAHTFVLRKQAKW
jgi:hypothetical protein